mgnify:FL=1
MLGWFLFYCLFVGVVLYVLSGWLPVSTCVVGFVLAIVLWLLGWIVVQFIDNAPSWGG